MRSTQLYQLQAFRRVQSLLNGNPARLETLNQTPAKVVLDDVVTKLEMHVLEQSTTRLETVGDTNRRRALEAELRTQHMQPIARFARANMQGVPEYKALIASGVGTKGERLVAKAQAMAAAAKPYSQHFVEAQFPMDFIESLVAMADAVKATSAARSSKAGRGVGATKGIAAEVRRGRSAVETLDAVVTKLLAGDAARLAEWRAAKRVVSKTGVRRSVGKFDGPTGVAA